METAIVLLSLVQSFLLIVWVIAPNLERRARQALERKVAEMDKAALKVAWLGRLAGASGPKPGEPSESLNVNQLWDNTQTRTGSTRSMEAPSSLPAPPGNPSSGEREAGPGSSS